MKDKRMRILVGSAVLGMILGAVALLMGAEGLVRPLVALGTGLRSLSEGGVEGNFLAWILVLGISLLPLLCYLKWGRKESKKTLLLLGAKVVVVLATFFLCFVFPKVADTSGNTFRIAMKLLTCVSTILIAWELFRKDKQWNTVDALVVLLCAELFVSLFFLVNPTILSEKLLWMDKENISLFWAMISFGTVMSTFLGWILLRLLGKVENGRRNLLPKLLFLGAVVYALFLGWDFIQTLGASWKSLGERTAEAGVVNSRLMLTALNILHLIPEFIAAFALLWGCDLAKAMETDPFGESLILCAEETARRCRSAARWTVAISIAGNLLQMLTFGLTASYEIRVRLPLLTIVLCAALYLLCGYFRRAKDIHDDNATII